MALVGALTPLGKAARKYGIKAALAYTLAGTVSALVVGSLLGLLGSYSLWTRALLWLTCPLALLLAARDFGWIKFRVPERTRQTEKTWAHDFGFLMASAMWGFHLGLGFATYIRYGGFWVLTLAAFAAGQPSYGALLMLVYWLGRALPVWVIPLIQGDEELYKVINGILSTRVVYWRSDAVALLWSAATLFIWATQNGIRALALEVIR
jgi:uncharacterized membrane protein